VTQAKSYPAPTASKVIAAQSSNSEAGRNWSNIRSHSLFRNAQSKRRAVWPAAFL